MKQLALAIALVLPLAASAQRNVGELLDQGGKLLDKAALVSALSGTTWQHPFYPGDLTYKRDGKYTGTVKDTANDRQVGIFGTWEVKDDGLLCEQSEGRYASPKPLCRYWFILGDRYFASQQANERSAPIGKRVPLR